MAKKTAEKKNEHKGLSVGLGKDQAAIMEGLLLSISKDYGKDAIMSIDTSSNMQFYDYQIRSGSIGLDIAFGPMHRDKEGIWHTGPVPGRIEEIVGPEATGKTTLLLQRIANAQAFGLRCALLDMEHNLDTTYAKHLGVDFSKLIFSQPDTGEQCLGIAQKLVDSGIINLIGIDSVAALIPKAEVEGDMGDSHMGLQARLMSQACRKLSAALGRGVRCNIIFTNQIREKIGVMFGSPETTPGGRALKFYASYRIDVRRGDAIKEGEIQIGHMMKARIIKNKVAPPFRQTELPLIYGHGIDMFRELSDLAVSQGILEAVGGSSFYRFKGHQVGQGKNQVADTFRTDAAMRYAVYDELLTRNLDMQNFKPDGTPIPGRQVLCAPTMVQTFVPAEVGLDDEVKDQEEPEEEPVELVEAK